MPNIDLRAELRDDPVGMGYAGTTDAEATDLLNGLTRTQSDEMPLTLEEEWLVKYCPTDVRQKIVEAKLGALQAKAIITADDKTALSADKTILISRATELGMGHVKVGHVQEVRR